MRHCHTSLTKRRKAENDVTRGRATPMPQCLTAGMVYLRNLKSNANEIRKKHRNFTIATTITNPSLLSSVKLRENYLFFQVLMKAWSQECVML